VLAILFVAVVVAVIGGVGVYLLTGHRRFDEVDRFHRASRMTTEWARQGVTTPIFAQPDGADDREPARAHAE
jgi:hypothetical protein